MTISDFNISFQIETWAIVLALIFIVAFTILIYRITIPAISRFSKTLLITIRSVALGLLLFAILEPILSIKYEKKLNWTSNIFIDNSKSIVLNDSSAYSNLIETAIEKFSNKGINFDIFQFSTEVNKMPENKLIFDGTATNFENIFRQESIKSPNTSSIVIVSDGNINSGVAPISFTENLNVPIYTFAIGDTTQLVDLKINRINFNRYVYLDKPTVINATISNVNYSGEMASASLYSNTKLISTKSFKASQTGINNISFDYTPDSAGEQKLSVVINSDNSLEFKSNNSKIFYLKVLNTKLKISLIGGAPSKDYSIFSKILSANENFEITKSVVIKENDFLFEDFSDNKLNNSDIMFLVGFPSKQSSTKFIEKVFAAIKEKQIPIFLLLNGDVDLYKLSEFTEYLPIRISNIKNNYSLAQLSVSANSNPLLKNISNNYKIWESLPPIYINNSNFTAKPNADIAAKAKIKNVELNYPIISSIKEGKVNSILLNADNVWRWQLQSTKENKMLLNSLINNSVKWLSSKDNQEQLIITSSKNVYNSGERIELNVQAYDETFQPVNNAEIKIKLEGKSESREIIAESLDNGIYQIVIDDLSSGEYKYNATTLIDEKELSTKKHNLFVTSNDAEQLTSKANSQLLKQLSFNTNGKYNYITEVDKVIDEIDSLNNRAPVIEITNKRIELWSKNLLLWFIIILFALEWTIRKRNGML